MVLLGGLELVAAGYIIHKHQKNKREKRRLQEEADALASGPSSSSAHPHQRTHSHDGRTGHHHSHRHDKLDNDTGSSSDDDEDPDHHGRNSRPKPHHLDPNYAATQPPRPSSVPPEPYPYWDQTSQAQHPYASSGPAPSYTPVGGPPFHPGASAPPMYQQGPPNTNGYPPSSFEAAPPGGGSNQEYYGYGERNSNSYPSERAGAQAQRNAPRRGSFERVSGMAEGGAAGAGRSSPRVRFALSGSDAGSVDETRRGRKGDDGYDVPPPEYTER